MSEEDQNEGTDYARKIWEKAEGDVRQRWESITEKTGDPFNVPTDEAPKILQQILAAYTEESRNADEAVDRYEQIFRQKIEEYNQQKGGRHDHHVLLPDGNIMVIYWHDWGWEYKIVVPEEA